MDNRSVAIETLRSEYDGRLLDPVERRYQAERLYNALIAARLWPSNPRILDVGCGAGFKLAFLGPKALLRVGCDIRREIYLQARTNVPQIHFIQASGMELPFPDGCFDLVTCISVIEEFLDFKAAFKEMARCVAPNGVLCINVTNGVLLQSLYRLAEYFGKAIPGNWRFYARASTPIVQSKLNDDYHMNGLEGWHYIHLTPYIIRSQFPIMRYFPISLLDIVSRRLAPTFVHAWQRPAESGEGRQ
jgi:SAM-dependent methyltransferase